MRSPSRRTRRKRSRSKITRYDSSEERTSPERVRRRSSRMHSPRSPPRRYQIDVVHKEESARRHRSREVEKTSHIYSILSITNIHPKASDENIREVVYKKFRSFGDFNIKITHYLDDRFVYVYFRNPHEAKSAKRSKPKIIFFDKVASLKPVVETRRSPDDFRCQSAPRSRSISPYDRYYKPTPAMDRHVLPSQYEFLYGPHSHPQRELRREGPPLHPDFIRVPYIPHSHMPLAPPPYTTPRNILHSFKLLTPNFDRDRIELKKDKFPNYLHHVPPEEDPLATRTLFVGNLDINISEEELRNIFGRYGIVDDIDIKRPLPGTGNAYAFVRYQNLDMAHKSKVELSGQYIGKFQCKIGYGKATPTTRIWVGGLGSWTSLAQVEREFDRFGAIKRIEYDKGDTCAHILYDSIDAAQAAVKEMRGFPLGGTINKLRVDFADVSHGLLYKTRHHSDDYPFELPYSAPWSDRELVYSSQKDFIGRVPWLGEGKGESSKGSHRRAVYYEEESHKEETKLTERKTPDIEYNRPFKDSEQKPSSRSIRQCSIDSSSELEKHTNGAVNPTKSLLDVARSFGVVWEGGLVLKNSLFLVNFHLREGDTEIVENLTKVEDGKHLLRITQRLRLDPQKLEDVSKRITASNSHAIFLGLPGSLSIQGPSFQTRPLKNLISYLKQKDAAGVISLITKDAEIIGVLYAFPPCVYSAELVKKNVDDLTDEHLKEDHLVIVVVRGGSA